jgi:hypothetical protein
MPPPPAPQNNQHTFGVDVLRCPCGGRRRIHAIHSTRKTSEARLLQLGHQGTRLSRGPPGPGVPPSVSPCAATKTLPRSPPGPNAPLDALPVFSFVRLVLTPRPLPSRGHLRGRSVQVYRHARGCAGLSGRCRPVASDVGHAGARSISGFRRCTAARRRVARADGHHGGATQSPRVGPAVDGRRCHRSDRRRDGHHQQRWDSDVLPRDADQHAPRRAQRDKGFKAENRARDPSSSPEFGCLPLHATPRFFPASRNS